MFSIRQHPSARQLRSFGLIVAGGFLFIGVWPLLFRHQAARGWALAVALLFAALALLVPTALRQPYRIWMVAGDCLGWINSKVVLSVVYYFLLTPVRLLMKLMRHDAMNRKFDDKAATYRVTRSARPASHMTHQF